MIWLNKLSNRCSTPAGIEWKLLKRMPLILLIGTLLPSLVALALRLFPWSGTPREINATLSMVDFLAIGAVIVHWTIVVTLTIGCIIILLMKGPGYVADAYPVNDADKPKQI